MTGSNTRRPPELSDLWEPIMSSAPQNSLFVITVQGGPQFKGYYNCHYSDGETIQLNEGPHGGLAEQVHVIMRSAVIAITTVFPS